MPGLLIKDLSESLHRRLKARAARHQRSLAREALVILEEALEDAAGPPSLAEVDRLRIRGGEPLTQEFLDQARRRGRP